ncbi:hypothetical protein NDS46_30325 (plasmid) [Paenibacillus thiaminolyticus]|uniref:hypothetical protein n=1 Tax=Paenibacillus thiaminolyticus TaxID=49283 RepID=UPI00232B4911|nr:hypothetical protein [Paenibacillus thiaminolyticus]WCF11645.1 hypothetical protein NDS46_30325 [Paenibacillus thiaminolyticus]
MDVIEQETGRRNSKKKVNGGIGRFRYILRSVTIAVYSILLSIFAIIISCLMFPDSSTHIQFLTFLLITLGYFTIVPLLYPLEKKFYMHPITEEQHVSLLNKKFIHYTDYLHKEEVEQAKQTGIIRLIANGSVRSNYNFRNKDALKKFVWFHPSREDDHNEPEFDSFCTAHLTESTPRDYKLIVDPKYIDRSRIYIRDSDGAIAIEGDYIGKAIVIEDFNWYNDKIYFWRSLRLSPLAWGLFFFLFFKDLYGQYMQIKASKKEKEEKYRDEGKKKCRSL